MVVLVARGVTEDVTDGQPDVDELTRASAADLVDGAADTTLLAGRRLTP